MSATSSRLEAGYDKILRWCTYEFTALRDTHIEVPPNLSEAVRRLRDRPELLTSALTTLAQTRSQTLMDAFLAALTRGGPGGLPRPIELHAHDPLRYVGDMLDTAGILFCPESASAAMRRARSQTRSLYGRQSLPKREGPLSAGTPASKLGAAGLPPSSSQLIKLSNIPLPTFSCGL